MEVDSSIEAMYSQASSIVRIEWCQSRFHFSIIGCIDLLLIISKWSGCLSFKIALFSHIFHRLWNFYINGPKPKRNYWNQAV